MSEPTKGPWKARLSGAGNYEVGAGGKSVACVYMPSWGYDAPTEAEEGKANLRLILSAEDLLEALLTALPYVTDVLDSPEQLACFKKGTVERDVKQIREALNKAIGE
jgi:hypothetical protein